MSTPEDAIEVEVIDSQSPRLADVLALYKANSGTLGFFPIGAFQEKAMDGSILVAIRGGKAVGYLLYNMTRTDAVVVHLCVASEHRGARIPDLLVKQMRKELHDDCPIRLTCRKDYEEAEHVWRRLGFEIISRKIGRGADKAELRIWRWEPKNERTLLKVIFFRQIEDRIQAAIDANVFFDLIDPESATNDESAVLTQEWLYSVVVLVRTPELNNEIHRGADEARKRHALASQGAYPEVRAGHEEVEQVIERLREILPSASTAQDHSDRRHVAHAIAAKLPYFITRDAFLLDCSDDVRRAFGTEVVNPLDFVLSLDQGRNATTYEPFRLAATNIQARRVTAADREAITAEFQRFPQRESKSAWKALLAGVLGDVAATAVTALVMPDGERLVVYATRRSSSSTTEITLLRVKGQKIALTAVRHVLMSVVTRASDQGCRVVRCSDAGSPQVQDALSEAGFTHQANGTWARALIAEVLTSEQLHALVQGDELLAELTGRLPPGPRAVDYERLLWPLKVQGDSVPCFIIPIKPHWARALFDHELKGQLFHAPVELACGLENVYYSGSKLKALRNGRGRVLWYVSQGGNDSKAMSVRACSILDDGTFASARELFNRNKRLGVYQWYQVSKLVKGEATKPITAIRFSHTELFKNPIDWNSIQSIFENRLGSTNPMAGPLQVTEEVFFDIYKRGMGRASAA